MESSKICPKCEKGLMFYHSYFHAYICDSCDNIERTIEADEKDKLIAEQEKKIQELQAQIKEMGAVIYECDYCDTCVNCVIEHNGAYRESECEIDRDNCQSGSRYEYRLKSIPKAHTHWDEDLKKYVRFEIKS